MPSIGKAIPHDSAIGHVTGEALYIDDVALVTGELYVEFAGSPVAHGTIKKIDLEAAKQIPGVVLLLLHEAIPGHNKFGPIFCDEVLLAEKTVEYIGQPVVIVAAETLTAARQARNAVEIEVEELEPVFSIDAALEKEQFLGPRRQIARGDFETAWSKASNHLERVFINGGQEQFYLESQACIAYPKEQEQVYLLSSTQNPTETQAVVAEVLGVGLHQVVCECKRMGGGFGGKETQGSYPAAMTALVATKTGKPARLVYTKDDDMKVTGKRHPYKTFYKVAFDDTGRIQGYQVSFYSNGGCAADLSTSILERTMLHADNAYFIPHIEINAQVCKTNFPPNTAFRGFGGPQGVAVIENIMQEIAIQLGKDAYEVRRANLYGVEDRNITPYGQLVRHNFLPQIFDQLEEESNYKNRLELVRQYNEISQTQLKGIAMTGVKFGISFTTKFLNQGNALVNVFTDGTVQVSTGGTEMGQGLNVKIRQLVADEFSIDIASVKIMTTSTEKNHNTSPTAASAGTDLNGFAAVNACCEIKANLANFAAQFFADPERGLESSAENIVFDEGYIFDDRCVDKQLPFAEVCNLAYRSRVNLGARGFYATPGVDFNRETGKGHPFLYYTNGAAVAEVLIDRFTGDLKVERVDLLMDIGEMINPGVDRGQVIGGFIQGMGWVTAEKLTYSDKGELLSYSPTTYKIPGSDDVPEEFNVHFIDNKTNVMNIRRSKAVGEPPLLLGVCAFAAAKHALSFVAKEGQIPELDLPATGEEILKRLTELRDDSGPDEPETSADVAVLAK